MYRWTYCPIFIEISSLVHKKLDGFDKEFFLTVPSSLYEEPTLF